MLPSQDFRENWEIWEIWEIGKSDVLPSYRVYYRVTIVRGRCPAGRTGTPRSRYLVRDAQQNLSRERERKFGTPSTTPSTSAMHFWGNRTEGGVTLSKQMRLVASGSVVRQRFFYGESAWCEMPPPSLKEGTYCSTVPTPPKKLYGSYTIYRVVIFGASSFGRFGRRGKTPNLNQTLLTPLASLSVIRNQSLPALLHSSGIVSPSL